MLRLHSLLLRLCAGQASSHRSASGVVGLLQQQLSFNTASSAHHRPGAALLVLHPASQPRYSLQEACRLAESLEGVAPEYEEVGSATRLRPSPSTFFGRGQVEAAQARVAATQPHRIFVNHVLSGVQQRNLECALQRPVLDRVGLIIEIFSRRARTAEARLQCELASLEYKASRLVRVVDVATGKRSTFGLTGQASEIVSARERGRSGSSAGGLGGAGGQGESELQLQRRRIADRRRLLLRKLEEVRKTRVVQRMARRRSGKPQIAIVGYTNAGKSSLLRALSKCGATEVGVEDRLFATLDPTLRRVLLPGSRRDAILSDTVGFISDLPAQLIEAFQATLEEVTEADLLLHVLDASSPQVQQQRQAVLAVLRELGVSEQRLRERVVEVWNKVDQLPTGQQAGQQAEQQLQRARQHEGEQEAERQQEEAGSAASSSLGSGSTGASGLQKESGSGSSSGAAAPRQLPAAVEALLEAEAAAGGYRPTAVATSVLHNQGLPDLLSAVESKLQALLDGQPQRSRRRAKVAAEDKENCTASRAPAGGQQQQQWVVAATAPPGLSHS